MLDCCDLQVNVARDVAVQMCDTLEGKAYTGVVNVSYMAVANEVRSVVCMSVCVYVCVFSFFFLLRLAFFVL